ncbi:MAG TPA: indolepyruvate ferredoxin oxidoreductase subunit alpha [Syntrophothermus lipocalidus]|nr:indolepyruvate ferredoxin oxidoreductase subunit alpha [Syntrophothermus lipocalidus]
MRRLMIGNEAIARGAYEAGATVATAYPGTPSTEILEFFSRYDGVYAEWAPNEKVAFEVGCGASIAGARTLVAMKHVGVNVAADPLFTFAYTGVNGGLVLVSADDPGMHSSQNEQDNRGYGKFAKLLVVEPSDSQEAKDFVFSAFELSERFDTPVMLRITTRLAHSQSMVEEGERQQVDLKPYTKDAAKYVMLPGHARLRHLEVEKRMAALREYVEESPLNRIEWGDRALGIVTSGVAYQYVKEVMPEVSVLKLGTVNPLPEQLVRRFAAEVDRLIVVEELEPVMEEQLKAWGIKAEGKNFLPRTGEYSPELLEERLLGRTTNTAYTLDTTVPARPPLFCPGCPHRGVFYTLGRMRLTVCGDIGCYTLGALKPLAAMDTTICMGASIGAALGMEKARGPEYAQKTVAVIGDSTFVHSGITGLIDVVYNRGISTVLILDNGTTAMTGHQHHPATGRTIDGVETARLDLEAVCRAVGVQRVRTVDPLDLNQLEAALKEELISGQPSVIIARRPCALLPDAGLGEKMYYVDEEACKGCRLCIKIGCTGIYWIEEERIARINPNLCVGCGLCAQICKLDAILEGGGR